MSNENGIRILANNRQARHNYHLLEELQVGMVLLGTEVKSAREGNLQLRDAYAAIKGNELWLLNAHISPYTHGNLQNHEPTRPRKLLAHRREINRLIGKTQEKGLTLVPTRIYLQQGRIKCDLALAKAKKVHDKREKIKRKEDAREVREAMRKAF